VKKLLALFAPWEWLAFAVAMFCLILAAFLGGGFPVDEYIKGITKAVYSAPPEVAKAKESLRKVGPALRAAAFDIKESKNRKGEPSVKTGIEASLCRAKWCKKDLVGTGICHGGDNEDIADCLTHHLQEAFGTTDYNLDEPSDKAPGKSHREYWFEELNRVADACDKVAG